MACPWCGENKPLVIVMWINKHDYETTKVCFRCRKEWLKRMKKTLGRLDA